MLNGDPMARSFLNEIEWFFVEIGIYFLGCNSLALAGQIKSIKFIRHSGKHVKFIRSFLTGISLFLVYFLWIRAVYFPYIVCQVNQIQIKKTTVNKLLLQAWSCCEENLSLEFERTSLLLQLDFQNKSSWSYFVWMCSDVYFQHSLVSVRLLFGATVLSRCWMNLSLKTLGPRLPTLYPCNFLQ